MIEGQYRVNTCIFLIRHFYKLIKKKQIMKEMEFTAPTPNALQKCILNSRCVRNQPFSKILSSFWSKIILRIQEKCQLLPKSRSGSSQQWIPQNSHFHPSEIKSDTCRIGSVEQTSIFAGSASKFDPRNSIEFLKMSASGQFDSHLRIHLWQDLELGAVNSIRSAKALLHYLFFSVL